MDELWITLCAGDGLEVIHSFTPGYPQVYPQEVVTIFKDLGELSTENAYTTTTVFLFTTLI